MNQYQQVSSPGNLGQYHYHSHTGAGTVTASDITTELASRGYNIHTPPPPPPVTITKSFAVKVAVDEALDGFRIAHSSSHFYRCPTTGGCDIREPTWNSLVTWAISVANGYMTKEYALPSWASVMLHGSFLSGNFALGSWLTDNPWVLTVLAGALMAYGQHLTSKNVADTVKQNVPKGALTNEDIPLLLQQLQAQGAIPAGMEATVDRGLREAASTTPSWVLPAAIGAGVLVLMTMMKR